MADGKQEIRVLLAPLAKDFVLLPSNVVAEVVAFTDPNPYDHAPAWLLGELEWNDWQVPVISLIGMNGLSGHERVSPSSRILIVKTLSDSTSIMYVGMLINGLPKLAIVTPDSLEVMEDSSGSQSIFARVKLDDQEALIPELNEVTGLVEQAIYTP